MGRSAATTELALDLRPPAPSAAVERAVAGLVREAAAVAGEGRVARLEEYTRGLEEERRKIEGFRRELPLCMLVIGGVIDGLKEEMTQCRDGRVASGGRPVLEEFMPLKRKHDEEEETKHGKDFRDMANWMSSAQLWSDNHSANTSSTTSNTVVTTNNDASSSNSRENTRERTESGRRSQGGDEENPFANCRYGNGGGAFLPFKVLSSRPTGSSREEEKATAAVVPLPDLSLLSPAAKTPSRAAPTIGDERRSGGSSSRCGSRVVGSSVVNVQPGLHSQPQPAPPSQQAPRKPRRCWSAELHRRFVKALQQLGGSQAATPKQIRELMNVDGLTNDEVKSHLQKYRLHTRRVSTPPSSDQQVVLLGGLWVPPENFPVAKQSTSQSGSPQGPLHLPGAGRGVPIAAGDSCDEEDGKSESYSWKGHLQRD